MPYKLLHIIYLFLGILWISFTHAGGHTPPPITTTPGNGVKRPPVQLGSYRVNEDQITLSGFSSGGTFAQQLQISYSSLFSGIGVFSHTYYRCGPGDGDQANFDNVCTMLGNFPNDRLYDPKRSAEDVQNYYRQGLIENPSNLRNKKLYVYTGTNNFLFSTDQSLRILEIYEPLIRNPAAIFTRVQTANLSLPSDSFGGACPADSSANFFIANCGINGPYEALKFLIGDWIQKPSRRPYLQPLQTFDQTEFYPRPLVRHDMDTEGFLYIPRSCRDGNNRCQLHVYFHGCLTGREFVGENHIRNSGYMELAETNGIIMLFPQAVKSPENDIGCWDTYNVTKSLFATQRGAQVTTVRNMLSRVLGSRFGTGNGSNGHKRPDTNFPSGSNSDTIFTRPGSSSVSSSGASSSAGRPGGIFSNNDNDFNQKHDHGHGHNGGFGGFGDRSGWRRRGRDDAESESFRFRYDIGGVNPFFAVIPPLYQQ